MSNVIGPINSNDWYTMRQLLSDVKWMKNRDSNKFKSAIDKESNYYNKLKSQYAINN